MEIHRLIYYWHFGLNVIDHFLFFHKRYNETMKIYIVDLPSYIWDTSHMTRHDTVHRRVPRMRGAGCRFRNAAVRDSMLSRHKGFLAT